MTVPRLALPSFICSPTSFFGYLSYSLPSLCPCSLLPALLFLSAHNHRNLKCMATLVHTYAPAPRQGILLNPSPAASPAYHPACLPALVPSNSSLSSSASSTPGDVSDYFSTSSSPSPGPSHSSPAPRSTRLPGSKPHRGSQPGTVRRIRFAPLPEPRRDEEEGDYPAVFLDDDEAVPSTSDHILAMSSALAAAVNCPLPASVPSSPCASRRTLPPLTHDSPGLDPSYSQSSSDSCEPGSGTGTHDAQPTTVPSDVGQEWDVVSPAALPALALSLSVPEHHSPRKTGGKLSKMLKPFFGRASSASAASSSSSHHAKSSPLARTFSREEAALINGDAQRGRTSSFLSAGSRNSSVSRDASLTRERRESDFGAPLHRWTSEGGPNSGLPVSKKKRHMLFGGGSSGGGVPLGRTQSLTSLSGKDDKKAKAQQQQRPAVVTNGGRKQQRMLNGRVYGAPRRKPNANPFANVRYVMAHLYCPSHSRVSFPFLLFWCLFLFLLSVYADTLPCVDRTDEEFVEWGYGGMGSVKNTAGQNSMWSRVQASDDAAGLARRTTDEDDGSGMAWLKRRREQREREKKEAEERAKAEAETEAQETAETNAEEGGAGEVAQEGDAGVKAAAAAPAEEQKEDTGGAEPETNTEDKKDAPVDASTVPLPVSAPSSPLVPDTPKPEHITQAINVPAPHAHHRHHHSHSHSHSYSHYGHHHTLSMPFVERRDSVEAARAPAPVSPPALAKVASEEGTPVPAALRTSTENKAEMEVEVEAAERESVSSSSASAMSSTSDDVDEEESPKDTEGEGGFGQDEDEDEEDEEAVSRFVLSLPCAWRYGKEVC